MCNCDEDWVWTSSTLSRTCDQAQRVLKRSLLRNFEYPQPKYSAPRAEVKGEPNLDEAFSSVMMSLSQCSNQCMQYYKHLRPHERNKADEKFCAKYLQSSNAKYRLK